jgi:tetratricopeptide (TPR) repeat protein
VLYSAVSNLWKIGDFGLTAPGTSRKALTTRRASGTACYRAPELLQERSEYNNKSDIFAIGCILYELVTNGKKAFSNDYMVHEYSATRIPIELPSNFLNPTSKCGMLSILQATLEVNHTKRPSAVQLRRCFSQNRAISIGHICRERGEYKISIKAYKKAFEEGSLDQEALKGLGDSYQAVGSYPEAIGAYERAINSGFKHPCIFFSLGKVFHARGDYEGAVAKYKIALKGLSTEEIWIRLGDAYMAKKCNEKAIQTFKDAIKKFPNRLIMYEKLGKAYFAESKFDDAIKFYEKGIKIASSCSVGLNNSSLLMARKDAYDARDAAIKAKKKNNRLSKASDRSSYSRGSLYSIDESSLISDGFGNRCRDDEDPRVYFNRSFTMPTMSDRESCIGINMESQYLARELEASKKKFSNEGSGCGPTLDECRESVPTVLAGPINNTGPSDEEYETRTWNKSEIRYETDETAVQPISTKFIEENKDQETETDTVTDTIAGMYYDDMNMEEYDIPPGWRQGDWYRRNVDQVVAGMRKLLASDGERNSNPRRDDEVGYRRLNAPLRRF